MSVPTTQLRGSTWFLRVTLPDGRRHRIRLGPSTMSEEQLAATARAVRAEFDRVGLADVTPVLTMDKWSERWLKARQRRGLTSTGDDEQRWRDWCVSLHMLDVQAVSRADVEAVVRGLDVAVEEERISWKTAANAWGVVSRMCRDMARSKIPELRVRDDNPADGVEPPDTGDSAARVYLYPSEMPALLACRDVPLAWRITYALAAYTGLRAGELAALRWADVDDGVVRLRRALDRPSGETKVPKSKETRNVPIEATLAPLLELVRRAPESLVVTQSLGQKGLGTLLRDHLVAAGLKRASLYTRGPGERPITFHDLRATALTWMALRGDAPQTIQQRAGHSSYTTTQGYVREAETIGFVGVPFPPMPDVFLAEIKEAHREAQSPKHAVKPRRKMEPTMGFEGTGNATKHGAPKRMGLNEANEGQRTGTPEGPTLARTTPRAADGLAALVADLERWELGATGTAGES